MIDRTEIEPIAGFDPIEYFEEAKVIGKLLARRQFEDDIPSYFGPRLKQLTERAYELEGLQFTYSGIGVGPARDPDEDLQTIYGNLGYRTAQFQGIGLATFKEMDALHIGNKGIQREDFDTLSHTFNSTDYEAIGSFFEQLKEPPKGFRLIADFMLQRYHGELPVRGHGVRSRDLVLMDTIDITTLNIFNIDIPPNPPGAEIWHIQPVLEYYHDKYRRMLRDPAFRVLQYDTQIEVLEQRIDELNTLLGLHQYRVKVKPAFVFVPEVSQDGIIHFAQLFAPEFTGKSLRADCMELQHSLHTGQRITSRKGNVDSNNSVCVVVEIDKDTQCSLGTKSTTVWVPFFRKHLGITDEKTMQQQLAMTQSDFEYERMQVEFYERMLLDYY